MNEVAVCNPLSPKSEVSTLPLLQSKMVSAPSQIWGHDAISMGKGDRPQGSAYSPLWETSLLINEFHTSHRL